MNKEEKHELVLALTEQIKEYGNFYITDTSDMRVAKNSLIKKAMEATGGDFSPIYDVLKGSSSILFSKSATAPAKLIKQLRKIGEKPILKAAYIDSAVFIGDNQLETLINLKSKEQLIGEIIGLLQ